MVSNNFGKYKKTQKSRIHEFRACELWTVFVVNYIICWVVLVDLLENWKQVAYVQTDYWQTYPSFHSLQDGINNRIPKASSIEFPISQILSEAIQPQTEQDDFITADPQYMIIDKILCLDISIRIHTAESAKLRWGFILSNYPNSIHWDISIIQLSVFNSDESILNLINIFVFLQLELFLHHILTTKCVQYINQI